MNALLWVPQVLAELLYGGFERWIGSGVLPITWRRSRAGAGSEPGPEITTRR